MSTSVKSVVDDLTKQDVLQLHDQLLALGRHNKDNVQQIVDILGGIDEILQQYLRSNERTLNQRQLQKLKLILLNEKDKTSPTTLQHEELSRRLQTKIANCYIHQIELLLTNCTDAKQNVIIPDSIYMLCFEYYFHRKITNRFK